MIPKNILFAVRPIDYNFPIGLRYINYIKYLSKTSTLSVINLAEDLPVYKQGSFFYRYANYFTKRFPELILLLYKREIKKRFRKRNFDTVIITVLPFNFMKLPAFIKKINKHVKIIVDMSDPVTGNISFKNVSSKRRNYLVNLEEGAIPHIDTLVVLNNELKSYYTKKYSNHTIVIEQGITNDVKTLCPKKEKSEKISLTYAGHLYKDGREPFELYKAVQAVRHNIVLNIYGKFNNAFNPPKEDAFFYGGKVTRQKLYQTYEQTDIIVFIDNKNTMQVPGKTLEVMALNKPTLFIYYNENSPTFSFTRQFMGVFYAKNESDDIKNKIEEIILSDCYYYKRDLSPFYWKNLIERISAYI